MSHQLFSYGPPNFKYDAGVMEILNPSSDDIHSRFNPSCSSPRIIIRNNGKYPLKQCTIKYGVEGSRLNTYEWYGSLEFLEEEVVTLPQQSAKKKKNSGSFVVEIVTPDENRQNNIRKSYYEKPKVLPREIVVSVKTNTLGRAAENQCLIIDSEGEVILYEDQLLDSTKYEYVVDLTKGCYQFAFRDDMEDGISRHWWNRNSAPEQIGINGTVQIESAAGDTLVTFPADFGQELLLNFIVE